MKKTIKKLFGALIASFTVCTLATSCNKEDTEHTIVFYHTMGDKLQKKLQIAISSFESKYPGWKVEHSQVGGYDDVKSGIIADLQGDNQPDIAYCYADHVAQYIQTEKVIDLKDYINSEEKVNVSVKGNENLVTLGFTAEQVSDFVEGYYNEGLATNYQNYSTYGYEADSMLTLPFVKSTELMYINKTAMTECGLTVPTTWDELWAQCDTILEKYPNCVPLGYDSESNWFITMCEQNNWGYTQANGNNFLFNGASQKAWLEDLAEKYEDGYFTTQNIYGSYTSNLFALGAEDGGCVYCIGSSAGASYQTPKNDASGNPLFEWAIAPIPTSGAAEGANKVISQGPSLVMFEGRKGVENKDLHSKMTFLFLKELMDPVFQASFSQESGYCPSVKSTYDNSAYETFYNGDSITAVAAKTCNQLVSRFYTSPAFVGSSTARTQVGNALVYAATGQKTADQALADAYVNCGGK